MCPSIDTNRAAVGSTTKTRSNVQAPANVKSPSTPASKPVAKSDNLSLSSKAVSPDHIKVLLQGPLPPAPPKSTASDWQTLHHANRDALIQSLRGDEAINVALKNWKNLPTDVKMQLGDRISNIQAGIFGFTPATLRVGEGKYHGGFKPGQIDIGPKSMVSAKEFLDTVVHEQNHEFQHEKGIAAFRRKLEPNDPYKEIAKIWLDNFDDYTTPAEGVKAYYAQPIEADATAMGNDVSRAVLAKP